MTRERRRWIATLDDHEARLLCCERAENGAWHAEPIAHLENAWQDDDALVSDRWTTEEDALAHRARLGPLADEDRSEMSRRRFARDVAEWIGESCADRHIDDLELYAPASSIRLLNRRLSIGMLGTVHLHAADLGWVEPSRLTRREEIRTVLEATNPEGGSP